MELRHLRYFVAIGEEENYRRAAQRLNVAQTALSTQIQDLEAELGFKLFDRLPRGVKLSAAGKLFLADARRILRDVNEAASRAARGARTIRNLITETDFVPILYRDPAFEAFGDFCGFVESVSCGTSKTCQVRGSSPCRI